MDRIEHFDGMVSCLTFIEQEQVTGIRIDKVLDVRRKLKSGEYDLAERLNAVVDRLLEDILL